MHSAAVLAPAQARRNTGAWLAVALLAAAYAMNFVDRQIVNLLVEPLKHDLQISDSQIGLLQGVSFGIFYTLMGLPFGWLSDRTHRVRLICAGMLIWSVMTAACGLTSSFHALFLARMGVGCGEAALVPAAISLLADLFDPHQRALPMSIFTGGVSVGSGLALALGGATIAYAAGGAHNLPLIGAWLGQHRPWQTTFILVGLAGVPVALLLLLIREPQRRVATAQSGPAQLDGLLMHLRRHRDVFLPMLLAVGCLYILTNAATAWIPSIFVREFDWHASAVGAALGLPVMISAMLGTLISGSVATWQARKGVPGAVLRTMVHGALFGLVPATVLAPLMPVDNVALAGVVLIFGTMTYTFAVATAVFVAITPNRLRGQMIALYLLVGNLFGLGLGPFSVGFCLDHVFQSPHPVGLALALVAFAAGLPGALLLRSSLPAYIALRAELSE